jgi:hypothetical protein
MKAHFSIWHNGRLSTPSMLSTKPLLVSYFAGERGLSRSLGSKPFQSYPRRSKPFQPFSRKKKIVYFLINPSPKDVLMMKISPSRVAVAAVFPRVGDRRKRVSTGLPLRKATEARGSYPPSPLGLCARCLSRRSLRRRRMSPLATLYVVAKIFTPGRKDD